MLVVRSYFTWLVGSLPRSYELPLIGSQWLVSSEIFLVTGPKRSLLNRFYMCVCLSFSLSLSISFSTNILAEIKRLTLRADTVVDGNLGNVAFKGWRPLGDSSNSRKTRSMLCYLSFSSLFFFSFFFSFLDV